MVLAPTMPLQLQKVYPYSPHKIGLLDSEIGARLRISIKVAARRKSDAKVEKRKKTKRKSIIPEKVITFKEATAQSAREPIPLDTQDPC